MEVSSLSSLVLGSDSNILPKNSTKTFAIENVRKELEKQKLNEYEWPMDLCWRVSGRQQKKIDYNCFFFQDLQSRADAQVSLLKENLASQSYLIKIGHQTS